MGISYKQISFFSKRLEIRPYDMSDYNNWAKAHQGRKPKQNRFDPGKLTDKELSREAFKKLLAKYKLQARRDEYYMFGIFDKHSGAHIGCVDLYVIVRKVLNWANLGYEIHNTHWNNGYATEAAKSALRIGFRDLGLYRIEAAMELNHKGSQAVARRIGMQKECVRKKFFRNGSKWEDLVVFVSTR